MTTQSVAVKLLRPTQIAVGMKLVKAKRKGLRDRERKPQELVDFILANPLRVVAGPEKRLYVIDHHHLAHALLDEGFKTAPVEIMGDLSTLAATEFWLEMKKKSWVHPFDGKGREREIKDIPDDVEDMEDDPYRSLAGFVRLEGGFQKTMAPYAEFIWADYYRSRVPAKLLAKNFDKALHEAKLLASHPDAAKLPGYIAKAEGPLKTSAKTAEKAAAGTAAE